MTEINSAPRPDEVEQRFDIFGKQFGRIQHQLSLLQRSNRLDKDKAFKTCIYWVKELCKSYLDFIERSKINLPANYTMEIEELIKIIAKPSYQTAPGVVIGYFLDMIQSVRNDIERGNEWFIKSGRPIGKASTEIQAPGRQIIEFKPFPLGENDIRDLKIKCIPMDSDDDSYIELYLTNKNEERNYGEAGFGRKGGGSPLQAWKHLFLIAKKGGSRFEPQNRTMIDRLNEKLRKLLVVDFDPIISRGRGYYKTLFKISM